MTVHYILLNSVLFYLSSNLKKNLNFSKFSVFNKSCHVTCFPWEMSSQFIPSISSTLLRFILPLYL